MYMYHMFVEILLILGSGTLPKPCILASCPSNNIIYICVSISVVDGLVYCTSQYVFFSYKNIIFIFILYMYFKSYFQCSFFYSFLFAFFFPIFNPTFCCSRQTTTQTLRFISGISTQIQYMHLTLQQGKTQVPTWILMALILLEGHNSQLKLQDISLYLNSGTLQTPSL